MCGVVGVGSTPLCYYDVNNELHNAHYVRSASDLCIYIYSYLTRNYFQENSIDLREVNMLDRVTDATGQLATDTNIIFMVNTTETITL